MNNTGKKISYHGYEVSKEGQKAGRVDYETLSNVVGAIMNNRVVEKTMGLIGNWELVNGCLSDDVDILTFYIITEKGAELLIDDSSDEIVLYNSELDMYVWGVTFWGTPYEGVLTDISLPDMAA